MRTHDKLVDVRDLRGRGSHRVRDHSRNPGLILLGNHLGDAAIVMDGDIVKLADAFGCLCSNLIGIDMHMCVDFQHGFSDLFLGILSQAARPGTRLL